MELGYKIFL